MWFYLCYCSVYWEHYNFIFHLADKGVTSHPPLPNVLYSLGHFILVCFLKCHTFHLSPFLLTSSLPISLMKFVYNLTLFPSRFGFLVALVLVYSTAFDYFLFIILYPPASTVSSSCFELYDYLQYWIITCCRDRFLWDTNLFSALWCFLCLLQILVWYSWDPDDFFLLSIDQLRI